MRDGLSPLGSQARWWCAGERRDHAPCDIQAGGMSVAFDEAVERSVELAGGEVEEARSEPVLSGAPVAGHEVQRVAHPALGVRLAVGQLALPACVFTPALVGGLLSRQ